MNGTNQAEFDGGESGSPHSKSFGGLNNIISKLVHQQTSNESSGILFQIQYITCKKAKKPFEV